MIGFFQRYVLHNLGLKVLSLILATGMWFMISRDEQPAEVAVRAPIVFQHMPGQLEISSESIPEAQIRVEESRIANRVPIRPDRAGCRIRPAHCPAAWLPPSTALSDGRSLVFVAL